MTLEYPYRIFIKIKEDRMTVRAYKYAILMGEHVVNLTNIPENGTSNLYFGNNKNAQSYWCCNGIIEDIHISKCIPNEYDYKEIDERIKITPLTLFKANLNNSLN